MNIEHFLADDQLNKQQILDLIALARDIKQQPKGYRDALAGKSVAMIFEKPSLRTHVSLLFKKMLILVLINLVAMRCI